MTERRETLVIGGGISGLASLWWLQRAGVDAVLFESSERLGGALRTVRTDGFLVETGANTVPGAVELRRIVSEVGLLTRRC